jgi:predicted metal-dependent HD superfamily phosphohydrolase
VPVARLQSSSANMETTKADDVKSQFLQLATSFGAYSDLAAGWAHRLINRYTEVGRHYHTVSHVSNMLSLLADYETLIHDTTAVKLAIFFHDFIYDPKAKDNEIQSAECFQAFARDAGLPEEMKIKVVDLIEATIKHLLSHDESDANQRADMRLFLDFDLEVLSWDETKYAEYAGQIRREYGHFSDDIYCAGRIAVLESFLKRERLYFSDVFYNSSEARARGNIQGEILDLRSRLEALSPP